MKNKKKDKKKPNHLLRYFGLVGLALLSSIVLMDLTAIATAIPFLFDLLDTSVYQFHFIALLFPLFIAVCPLLFRGSTGGRKGIYLGALFFGLGSFLASTSCSFTALFLARGVQALGAGCILATAEPLVSLVFPAHEKGKALGIYGGITGFFLLIGSFLSGFLIDSSRLSFVFWMNIPLAFLGSLLFVFSSRIQEKVSLAQDFSFFKDKLKLLGGLAIASCASFCLVYLFFDPLYIHLYRGASAFQVGTVVSGLPIGQLTAGYFFNRLEKKFGFAYLLFVAIGFCFIAASLHLFMGLNPPLFFLSLPLFLIGAAWGLTRTITAPLGLPTAALWGVSGALTLALSALLFHTTLSVGSVFNLASFKNVVYLNVLIALAFLVFGFRTLVFVKQKEMQQSMPRRGFREKPKK